MSQIQTLGALLFPLLHQEARQFGLDFGHDHLPDLAVLRSTTLSRIGYVPVRDPFRYNHVTEIRHVHLGHVVELDVRKSGNVSGFVAAQIAADLAHGFHRLLVNFLTGFDAGTANLYAALGRHFQHGLRHWAAARVFDANEEYLQNISNFSHRPKRLVAEKSTEAQVLCDRPREFAQRDQEES